MAKSQVQNVEKKNVKWQRTNRGLKYLMFCNANKLAASVRPQMTLWPSPSPPPVAHCSLFSVQFSRRGSDFSSRCEEGKGGAGEGAEWQRPSNIWAWEEISSHKSVTQDASSECSIWLFSFSTFCHLTFISLTFCGFDFLLLTFSLFTFWHLTFIPLTFCSFDFFLLTFFLFVFLPFDLYLFDFLRFWLFSFDLLHFWLLAFLLFVIWPFVFWLLADLTFILLTFIHLTFCLLTFCLLTFCLLNFRSLTSCHGIPTIIYCFFLPLRY